MKIEILGSGCMKCKKLYENTLAAVKEAQVSAEVVKVEDMQKIISYGVMSTPAIVIDGKIKASGQLLSPEEIKKLF